MMERASIQERLRISFSLPEEVDVISSSLGKHLSHPKQDALRDKIERYTRKDDRIVVIGRIGDEIIGYVLVIQYLDPPESLTNEVRKRIAGYGCVTGVGVNPEWRRNGIGGQLLAEGLKWAEGQGLPGVWLRTRLFAEWYIKDFGFKNIGTVTVKETVIKSVLAKAFRHEK